MDPCPLCTQRDSRRFPIHYALGEKSFEARQCSACGFIFLTPRLSAEDIASMYSDEYFLFDGADYGAHSMTDYETAAVRGSEKFPEILRHIKRFREAGQFLEVGCGMGYFLDYVRRNGFEVEGLEYAALGVNVCRQKFGLNVVRSSFEAFPERPEKYDVVFFGDVLEHLIHPLEMLEKARRLLRPGGVVAAEVPSMFNSLVGRLAVIAYRAVGFSKRMSMPPYHVNEFLPVTLRSIVLRAGFQHAEIIQRVKRPSTIALRGNPFERSVKLGLQYPNVLLTKAFGILGDRLLGIGVR